MTAGHAVLAFRQSLRATGASRWPGVAAHFCSSAGYQPCGAHLDDLVQLLSSRTHYALPSPAKVQHTCDNTLRTCLDDHLVQLLLVRLHLRVLPHLQTRVGGNARQRKACPLDLDTRHRHAAQESISTGCLHLRVLPHLQAAVVTKVQTCKRALALLLQPSVHPCLPSNCSSLRTHAVHHMHSYMHSTAHPEHGCVPLVCGPAK